MGSCNIRLAEAGDVLVVSTTYRNANNMEWVNRRWCLRCGAPWRVADSTSLACVWPPVCAKASRGERELLVGHINQASWTSDDFEDTFEGLKRAAIMCEDEDFETLYLEVICELEKVFRGRINLGLDYG